MTKGYAAHTADTPLGPFEFTRRAVGPTDVVIQILYCGVCHSDIHTARNEWHGTKYPVVPGHEIVGKVTQVGAQVTQFSVGEMVGVGCMVDSCRQCIGCAEGLEQYCEQGATYTYNSPDKHMQSRTYGGYSDSIVVDENFVLRIPSSLDLKAVAPLLCAGITLYSPLRHWHVTHGTQVGIIGLGGLGHMGVKLARAMGATVTMITTSPQKAQDAIHLGAHDVLISTDRSAMETHANRFDLLLNTIPHTHDVDRYLPLLKRDATIVMLGALEPMTSGFNSGELICRRKTIAGSIIGGIRETQEMLDFCSQHQVIPDVEMIAMTEINTAYERMLKNDVRYRFVIDMSTL